MKCYKKALQFYNNIPTNQVFCKTPGFSEEDGDDDDDDYPAYSPHEKSHLGGEMSVMMKV